MLKFSTEYYRTIAKDTNAEKTVAALCDEIDRLRKQIALKECQDQHELAMADLRPVTKQTLPQGKTVRVNIPVEVTLGGWWNLHEEVDFVSVGSKIYTLAADLLIPSMEENLVEARVEGE